MYRLLISSLFFSIFYTACFFCPEARQDQEKLERDLAGFLGKTHTGKMKTSDGKVIAFELKLSRYGTTSIRSFSWGSTAYAASCNIPSVGVTGVVRLASDPALNIEVSGPIYEDPKGNLRFSPTHPPRNPVCHIFQLSMSRTLQLVDGSYKHNPECGEATLKEAVMTELKPK